MIYCIRFDDVLSELEASGYTEAERTEATRIFVRRDGGRILFRVPNQDGHLPEILVNSAFDAAGLIPPKWDVFWCD